MDYFLTLYQSFMGFTKTNPVVAGAVSLWGLTVITLFFVKIPQRIFHYLSRELTTTLEINNDHVGTNLETFNNFLRWHKNSRWSRWSRSLSLSSEYSDHNTVVGIGNGRHYFWYKRRFFWMNRSQVQQSGGYHIYHEIKINMLGRNRQILLDLIEEIKYQPAEDRVGVFTFEKEWSRLTDVAMRRLETVIIEKSLKARLIQLVTEFKTARTWYEVRGLPYKLTMLFHGLPGTGKSSLIKAFASHFKMNLCVLNLSGMSDAGLQKALSSAPVNSLVVIEDFDSTDATQARSSLLPYARASNSDDAPTDAGSGNITAASSVIAGVPEKFSFLTLSGILNSLDGVVALDETIIILTSNVIDQLDPAILRPGRIDHIIELKYLESPEVHDYLTLMFPDQSYDREVSFKSIAGCELQRLYFENKHDLQSLIDAIPKNTTRLRSVI